MDFANFESLAANNVPTVSLRRKAARLACVLRYHRPSQLARRLLSLARRRLIGLTAGRYSQVPPVEIEPRAAAGLGRMAERKLEERALRRDPLRSTDLASRREGLLAGRYCLLGVERELPDPIDWRLATWPEGPHLWRFHLHYHEFLLDLVAEGCNGGRPELCDRAWDVAVQWIDANPLGGPTSLRDAWHPFCISRRIPVWIAAWSASPPDASQRQAVLASLFRQARFLEDHLERDLGGNHLLENARGLVLVGCFLKGRDAERWRRKGAGIIQAELPEQILPHGEHFERSPGYHGEMLDVMLDVRDAAAEILPDLSELCAETAERMARFLAGILHPDGDVPLWGDCWLAGREVIERRLAASDVAGTLRVPSSSRRFVSSAPAEAGASASRRTNRRKDERSGRHLESACYAAGGRRSESACCVAGGGDSDGGCNASACTLGDTWVWRDGDDCLLFDAGPVGPDHLPAHAHADLLSFEASLAGRRVFVDSGVSGYEDDPLRRYCRSTAAHNVLQLDGGQQCDLWSRFRMGYRGRPTGLHSGRSGDFDWALAHHNAYHRLGVPAVGRFFACRQGGPWVCVDRAHGRGRHDLAHWLHLHPDVAVEQTADDEVRLEVEIRQCRLRYITPGKVTIVEGRYCEGFGQSRPAPVLLWEASLPLPAVCGWWLSWDESCPPPDIDCSRPERLVLRWRGQEVAVDWPLMPGQ